MIPLYDSFATLRLGIMVVYQVLVLSVSSEYHESLASVLQRRARTIPVDVPKP